MPRASTGKRPFLWIASSQTPGVFTTCTAMFGNGARMSGTTATKVRLQTELLGAMAAILDPRRPRRFVVRRSSAPPRGHPQLGHYRLPERHPRVPVGQNVKSLILICLTFWVRGEAPVEFFGDAD